MKFRVNSLILQNLKAKEEEKDPPRGPLSKQSTRCRGRDTLSRTFKTGGGESVAEKREEIREEERSSLCLCTGCFEQLIQPLWRNNRLAKCSPAAACCYTPSAEANSLQRRPQTTKVLGEVVRNWKWNLGSREKREEEIELSDCFSNSFFFFFFFFVKL